jgi:hypothetical protein
VDAHRPGREALTGAPGAVRSASRRPGSITACDNRMAQPARRASDFRGSATSAAAGAEPCAVPLHGEGPGSAPAFGNFRGTATWARPRGRGVPRMQAAGPA